jgi:serine/threonine protein kinase
LKHSLKEVNSIAKRVELVHDVAVGLSWLQAHNIVHRDLKLDNLLVTEDWTIKITCVALLSDPLAPYSLSPPPLSLPCPSPYFFVPIASLLSNLPEEILDCQ